MVNSTRLLWGILMLASIGFGQDFSSHCVPFNFSEAEANSQALVFWGWTGWFVLGVVFALFVALFFEVMPIEFAMVAAVSLIAGAQIITIQDMTKGFSNPGILSIACLLIVAEGLTATGAIDYFMAKLLGAPKTLGQALLRMMLPCSFIAAWISSTAVVALMIPVVQRWGKRIKQPPSLLLMPMCFAIHLGGTMTVMGSTTNLIIAGLYREYFCHTVGIFELSTVGLPVAMCGMGFLLLFTPWVLPNSAEFERRTTATSDALNSTTRRSVSDLFACCKRRKTYNNNGGAMVNKEEENSAEFSFDAIIPANSVLNNQSIEEAKMRNLSGLFLTTIQRGPHNTVYNAVGPWFKLRTGDRLTFAGLSQDFLPFCQQRGLIPVMEGVSSQHPEPLREFSVAAQIGTESSLIGKCMKDVQFRTTYRASVLAIYRQGQRVKHDKIGQVVLRAQDVLLLVVSDSFDWNARETVRDFHKYELNFKITEENDNHEEDDEEKDLMAKEYIFSMRVSSQSQLAGVAQLSGLSIEHAGLKNLPGIRVVAVNRHEIVHRAVGPDFVLNAGDIVYFSAERDGLSQLRRIPGLEDVVDVKQIGVSVQNRRLVEVVISLQSALLGKTVRESRFRSRFQAAIMSVQRRGQRILAKVGDIELQAGDVLLLDAGPEFVQRFAQDDNFLLIFELDQSAPPRMDRFYIAILSAMLMVLLTAVTGKDMLIFALFACAILLSTGVLTRERALRAVDWKIIITVAAAFGLSKSMTNTKVSDILGRTITQLAMSTGTGDVGVLVVVMVCTELLCALITAKAGALLMFPIAMSASSRLNIDPITMVIALMVSASDYTTPQGHPTNLMVMGPGAYKFADYQKVGFPLEFFLNVVQLLCLHFRRHYVWTTLCALGFLLFCVAVDHVWISRLPLFGFLPSISRREPMMVKKKDVE